MSEHENGTHRDQTVLFPDTIDKYVEKENPVKFIDAFVDSLNLEKLGFKHSVLADTGRPSYNPSDLLKLYIYGYLNQVRPSRKLEQERPHQLSHSFLWTLKFTLPQKRLKREHKKAKNKSLKSISFNGEFLWLIRKNQSRKKKLLKKPK